jgi:hypothetical protein
MAQSEASDPLARISHRVTVGLRCDGAAGVARGWAGVLAARLA